MDRWNAVSGHPNHTAGALRRPVLLPWRSLSCIWAGLCPSHPHLLYRGNTRSESEEVFSRQCRVPPPNSCCYHKHPEAAGHPGTAPFHRSSQASVAGASAQHTAVRRGTRHSLCSQGGHHSTSKSPPKFTSLTKPEAPHPWKRTHPPAPQSTQLSLRHTEACHKLVQALLPAWQSAAETSAPLPTQPGRKLAKRGLGTAAPHQVGLGHQHRAATPVRDSPSSAALRPSPTCHG